MEQNLQFITPESILPSDIDPTSSVDFGDLFGGLFENSDTGTIPLPVEAQATGVILVESQSLENPSKTIQNGRRTRNSARQSAPRKPKMIKVQSEQSSPIVLDSEDIKKLSPQDIENIAQSNELSTGQKQDLKKVRRQVRNRESAQMSRQKKKDYIVELEDKVEELSLEKTKLSSQVTALEAESKTLKEEIDNLTVMIKDSPFLSNLLLNMTVLCLSVAPLAQKSIPVPSLPMSSYPSSVIPSLPVVC